MKLRVGLGPVGKAFAVVVCGFLSAVALAFGGAANAIPALTRWFPAGIGPDDLGIWGKVLAVVMLCACAYALVHAFRYGVRLDGTTVTVRGAFTTSRVNLAAAHRFWFDEKKEHTTHQQGSYEVHTVHTTPLLCASDRHGTVRIPLSYYGRRMRTSDYRALAVAIAKGQRYRDRDAAVQASQAVHALGGRMPAWQAGRGAR